MIILKNIFKTLFATIILSTYSFVANAQDPTGVSLGFTNDDVQQMLNEVEAERPAWGQTLRGFTENSSSANTSTAHIREIQREISQMETEKYLTTQQLKEKWNDNCYSCIVVGKLISTFMEGAAKLYPITSKAGNQLLIFGFIIWVSFWGFKNMASFSAANGTKMTMEVLTMLFKICLAFIFINAGISLLVAYAIEPILSAGADYANAILDQSPIAGDITLDDKEKIITSGIISADALNKMMLMAKSASNTISGLMVVGAALINFGFEIPLDIIETWFKNIEVIDFISIIIGAIVWFVGFLLSFVICFYLLDISFRLGFAVVLLPIAIGLWPFPLKDAKGKIGLCFKIAISSAGLFIFLAITTTVALTLIDASFGPLGMQGVLDAIDNDDKTYIRDFFDISKLNIVILLFSLIAAFKLISKSESFNQSFFSAPLSGAQPMHYAATAMQAKIINPAKKAASTVGRVATYQAGRGLTKAGSGIAKGAASIFKKKPNANINQGQGGNND